MFKFKNKPEVEYVHDVKTSLTSLKVYKELTWKLNNWHKEYELRYVTKLGKISKWTVANYLDLPLNNQKTRSRKPKKSILYFQIKLYKTMIKFFNLQKIKYTKNYLKFDLINRIWYLYYKSEFFKIRKKRLAVRAVTYKNRVNINFPILKYKYVIRNLKKVHKKKQKLMNNFNLGFFFYEYIDEKSIVNRLNKKLLKKNFNKLFILKK